MFITDRDLLVLEPNLFRDAAWIGQRLSRGTGTVSGTTLTVSSPEVAFDAAGIDAGAVATVAGVSYEVAARLSGTQLQLSRLRDATTDAVIPPAPATGVEATVVTFKPQIGTVHRQILRMLGFEPDGVAGSAADLPPLPSTLTEAAITNPGALRRLESLGALHAVLAAAGALLGPDAEVNQRAEAYRQRFIDERQRVVAYVDTNGDGRADVARRPNVAQFVRG